jgi:hypothetical protein
MGALGAAGIVDTSGVAAAVVAVEVATFIAVGGAVQPASANRIMARTSGLTGATTLRLRLTVFTSVDCLICSESFVSDATLAAASRKNPALVRQGGVFR